MTSKEVYIGFTHPTHSLQALFFILAHFNLPPLFSPLFVHGLSITEVFLTTDKICHLQKRHHCYSVPNICQGAYFKWIV